MDIKLKNNSSGSEYSSNGGFSMSNGFIKFIATLICLAGINGIFFGIASQPYFDFFERPTDYNHSSENRSDLSNTYEDVFELAFKYKNAEWIKTGKSIDPEALANRKDEIISEKNEQLSNLQDQYANWIDRAKSNKNTEEVQRLTQEKNNRIKEINIKYDQLSQTALQTLINEQLKDYEERLSRLNTSGFDYLVTFQDGKHFTNKTALAGHTPEAAATFYSSYLYSENGSINSSNPGNFHFETTQPGNSLFVAIPQNLLVEKSKAYALEHKYSKWSTYAMIGGLVCFLLSVAYLIVVAGRKKGSEGISLTVLDRLYLDFSLGVVALGILGCFALLYAIGSNYYRGSTTLYLYSTPIICVGTLLGLFWVTSASKRLKRREFLKHTLVYHTFSRIGNGFSHSIQGITALLHQGPAAKKAFRQLLFYVSATLGCGLLGIIFIQMFNELGFMIALGLLGALNYLTFKQLVKKYDHFNLILLGTRKIKEGDLHHRIPVDKEFGFEEVADNINNIAQGLKNSVDSEVRSERLKAELVTNVSHDLKTPLTSIITYVDLLKKEGLQSENAPEYLEILDQKSQRLKTLTEDLFEAAKASSGNIPVTFTQVDIVELLTQGLGEMADQIEQSGLQFKISLPNEHLYIRADGKLLWRVMENLLSNVFKYTLPGSRVYLEALKVDGNLCISLKNISSYALNIPAEELMERFKRGDVSRNSEGSGLGLSIARSLTEIQGGHFDVSIDGDLFKVSICFKAITE